MRAIATMLSRAVYGRPRNVPLDDAMASIRLVGYDLARWRVINLGRFGMLVLVPDSRPGRNPR